MAKISTRSSLSTPLSCKRNLTRFSPILIAQAPIISSSCNDCGYLGLLRARVLLMDRLHVSAFGKQTFIWNLSIRESEVLIGLVHSGSSFLFHLLCCLLYLNPSLISWMAVLMNYFWLLMIFCCFQNGFVIQVISFDTTPCQLL